MKGKAFSKIELKIRTFVERVYVNPARLKIIPAATVKLQRTRPGRTSRAIQRSPVKLP